MELATCSYRAFERHMGLPVRITLSAPRFIKLPDAKYGEFTSWPSIIELAPQRSYFKAPADEFDRRYLDQIDALADVIGRKLTALEAEGGRIVLLCYEREISGPADCHRRLAARFLEERFGVGVPELDAAPGGCS